MRITKLFLILALSLLTAAAFAQDDFEEEEITAGEQDTEISDQENEAQFSSAEGAKAKSSGEVTAGTATTTGKSRAVAINGYVDVGFFFAGNGGRGFVKDYNEASNVNSAAGALLGDYASTYINSRHESADQGFNKFFMADPVQSIGRPTFMVNEVFLHFVSDVSNNVRVSSGINAIPRETTLGGGEDVLELDTAQVDIQPFDVLDMTITAGKFMGITGIEYRWRKSHERWGITPSLLGRYTNGTPVGVKVRGKHFDKRFVYNLGVTNGSNFIDSTRLNEDVDTNVGKTYSGRLSYDLNFGPISLFEVGFSGEWGTQSGQADEDPKQLVWGPDLQIDIAGASIRGQFFKLDVDGGGSFDAKKYEGDAFYVEGFYGFSNILGMNQLGVYGRLGRRDVLEQDSRYTFLVDVWRITPGIQLKFTPKFTLKAEYVINLETGDVPSFDNDVFTTSLVAQF